MDRSTAVFDQPLHIGLHWLTPSMAHVVVKGEIDMTNAHLLREQLCRAIREHQPATMDLDLADVSFLDCAGIGALITVRAALESSILPLRLKHPQPIVRRVLDLTGLMGIFGVTP